MSGGAKILEGLKEAIAGNFDRVQIDGQVWVRRDSEIERLRAAGQALYDALTEVHYDEYVLDNPHVRQAGQTWCDLTMHYDSAVIK